MNQRVFSRVPVRHTAAIIYQEKSFEVRLQNAGLGGFFLEGAPPLEVGQTCRLEIHTQEEEPILLVAATGIIHRSDDQGVALGIKEIEPSHLRHLRRLVAYNAPDADQILEEADSDVGTRRLVEQMNLRIEQ